MKLKGNHILSIICLCTLMPLSGILMAQSNTTGHIMQIGSQKWATTNLNVISFANGDSIPEAKTAREWEYAGIDQKPAWCYYDNDPENGVKYGRLYNWYAVNDPRGLAPKGSHIPADAEWTALINYLGGEENAMTKMKNTSGWKGISNGNNSSGFAALPGGSRNNNGQFRLVGNIGFWWSSTELDPTVSWYRYMHYSINDIGKYYGYKSHGLSVRYILD